MLIKTICFNEYMSFKRFGSPLCSCIKSVSIVLRLFLKWDFARISTLFSKSIWHIGLDLRCLPTVVKFEPKVLLCSLKRLNMHLPVSQHKTIYICTWYDILSHLQGDLVVCPWIWTSLLAVKMYGWRPIADYHTSYEISKT